MVTLSHTRTWPHHDTQTHTDRQTDKETQKERGRGESGASAAAGASARHIQTPGTHRRMKHCTAGGWHGGTKKGQGVPFSTSAEFPRPRVAGALPPEHHCTHGATVPRTHAEEMRRHGVPTAFRGFSVSICVRMGFTPKECFIAVFVRTSCSQHAILTPRRQTAYMRGGAAQRCHDRRSCPRADARAQHAKASGQTKHNPIKHVCLPPLHSIKE